MSTHADSQITPLFPNTIKKIKRRYKMKRLVLLLGVMATLAAGTRSYAQVTTAAVEGYIHDAQGKTMGNVTVIVQNHQTGITRGAYTSSDGYYNVSALQPGTYDITVEHVGYHPSVQKGVKLLMGQVARMNFTLQETGVQMKAVEVTANAQQAVEMKRVSISMPVLNSQITSLPLNSRSVLDLAQVAPGVRYYAPIGGQSLPGSGATLANISTNMYVDGMEWKDFFVGNIVGLGQIASPVPEDAIQEFRVILDSYDAEYARIGVLTTSMVIKRGTNQFRGTAFGTFENKGLTSRGPFQKTKPDFNREQSGFSISGPIVMDKLFYSATYELDNNISYLDIVPGRPSYDPNIWSKYAGTFKSPLTTHLGTIKFTYQPSNRNTMDLMWNTHYTYGVDNYLTGLNRQYHVNNVMFEDTYVLSDRAVNELTLQFLSWRHHESPVYVGQLSYPSITFGRGTYPIRVSEDRYTLADRFSYNIPKFYGEHNLKAGIELSYDKVNPWYPFYSNGAFFFKTDTSSMPYLADIGIGYYNPNSTSDAYGNTNGYVLGAYVQDRWNVNERLTLNLGLRWDGEIDMLDNTFTVPWASDPVITNDIPSQYINRGNRKNPLLNFGPRISFSYDISGDGMTMVHGGFGITYDQTLNKWAYLERSDASWRVYSIENPGTTDPAVLRQMVMSGQGNAAPSIDLLDTNLPLPRYTQWSVGISHQFNDRFAGSLDFVNSYTSKITQAYDANYYDPITKSRILTNKYGDIWLWSAFGNASYEAFLTSLTYRDNTLFAQLSYTLSWSYATNGGYPAEYVLKSLFYSQRSNYDERHRVVVNWTWTLPAGFQLSGIATLASPTPFAVSIGQDLNNDNNYGDDWPSGQRNMFPDYSKIRNWYKDLDLRVTKFFNLESMRLGIWLDAFNAGNWFNASGYFGRMHDASGNPLTNFGDPSGSYAPRTVQIGARVYF